MNHVNNEADAEVKIVSLYKAIVKKFRYHLSGSKRFSDDGKNVRGALAELMDVASEEQTVLGDEQRTLLENIVNLRDRTIADVMVPRADIVSIDVNAGVDKLIDIIIEEAHSRVPVFNKVLDDAIGMVHIKDVISAQKKGGQFNLREILRPVLFVAPSMHILELLLEMRAKRTHMALVVDEFGGVDGLLSIEDLVEEIVGEIEDEHDRIDEPGWSFRGDGTIDVDARLTISQFEEVGGVTLTNEERKDADTLGGLVFLILGRVPVRGELVEHTSGIDIEIIEADSRRIKKLRLHAIPPHVFERILQPEKV